MTLGWVRPIKLGKVVLAVAGRGSGSGAMSLSMNILLKPYEREYDNIDPHPGLDE